MITSRVIYCKNNTFTASLLDARKVTWHFCRASSWLQNMGYSAVTKTQKRNYLPEIINKEYVPANSSMFTYV